MAKRAKVVAGVVEKLGGIVQATAIARTTAPSMYDWRAKDRVRLAEAAVRLAEAAEPTDLAARWRLLRRLVGIDT